MEGNNKNQSAIFLMVVGVIFIVIAGAIFVTTAWKYLPVIAKQAILLSVTVGLFAGAGKAYKSKKMEKTEIALFYLAVAFSGFFILSLLSNVNNDTTENMIMPDALNLMMAGLIMMIPTFFRLLKTRKGLDFAVLVVLLDGVLSCFTAAFGQSYEWEVKIYSFLQAGVILLFALGDYHRQKWLEGNRGLDIGFSIIYLIHGIGYVLLMWIEWLGSLDGIYTKGQGFILAAVLAAATFLTYVSRKQTVCRVFNSLSILWCVLEGVSFVNSLLPEMVKMSAWGILFTVYIINLVIMVCTLRREMIYTLLPFGMLVPVAQLFSYGGYPLLFTYIPHTPTTYIPFTVCMMLAMLLLAKRRMENGEITWEEEGKRLIKAAGIQGITVLIMLQAAAMEGFLVMGICVWLMVLFLTAAIFSGKNEGIKNISYTFALGMGELAAFNQPYVEIPNTYAVEWVCFLLGIGIVLLHLIWYDETNDMRVISFVLTCVLLAVLLINNIIQGGLGNVIILGVTGVLMLLIASIFNYREYVIAASVTLILLVLYITRSFWLSIAWWVYLFVAGVVLVLLAIKKESTGK